LKSIALFAITAYQRYVSPYKGFCCAYRVHTGQASCSALGYRAIRMRGVWSGIAILRKRFDRCATAFEAYRASSKNVRAQRGSVSCDLPCDLPSFDCGHGLDALQCCDLPCDCGGGKSRKGGDDAVQIVSIPPTSRSKDA